MTTRYVPFARSLAAYSRRPAAHRRRRRCHGRGAGAAVVHGVRRSWPGSRSAPASTPCCSRCWRTRSSGPRRGWSSARRAPSRCWSRRRSRRWPSAAAPQYAALAAMLAIMVGVVFLVARLARLGWIADYFSQAVLVGYITGVAIVLILGQLGKLLGISSDEDGAIRETLDIVAPPRRRQRRHGRRRCRVPRPAGRRGHGSASGSRARSSLVVARHRRVVGAGPRRPGGLGHRPRSQRPAFGWRCPT